MARSESGGEGSGRVGSGRAPVISASDFTSWVNANPLAGGVEAAPIGNALRGASAQPGTILTAPAKGRSLPGVEGIYLFPALSVAAGYNDNVLGTAGATVDSFFYSLRPELVAEAKRDGDRYTLSYQGNYVSYADAPGENFFHHDLWAAMDRYLSVRARFGVGVGYVERTDPRGAVDRPAGAEPDHWHAPVARVIGIYGAEGAIGRIELEAAGMARRYDNNRVFTEASDVDIAMFAGRFFYRLMPRTSLLFELRGTLSDYVLSSSTQDNVDQRYYVGVTWEATAKTTGTLKIGSATKNFSSAARNDATMLSWEAGVRWAPLSYSVVDLVSSKIPVDATGLGNFITNNGSSLTWTHRWSSLTTTRLALSQVSSRYDGALRNDDAHSIGFAVYRALDGNARLGLDWSRVERDSNQNLYDLKRETLMCLLELML